MHVWQRCSLLSGCCSVSGLVEMVARGLLAYSSVSVVVVLLCVAQTLQYSHQLYRSAALLTPPNPSVAEAATAAADTVPAIDAATDTSAPVPWAWPTKPFSTLSSVVSSLPYLLSPSLSRASPSVFVALFIRFRLNVLSVVNLLCALLCLCTAVLALRVFSPLSDHEKKACRENLFNFLVFRCVFVAAVVPLELRELACWVSFFSIVAALRVVIILARERFTSVTVQPTAGADVFVRLIGVMAAVCVVDVLVAGAVWYVLLRGDASVSVVCLMLFEHVVLLLGSLKAGGKYVIHLFGLRREAAWEERNSWLYYCEFVFECLIQLLTVGHYVHVWWLYGLSVTIIDLFLFLHLRSSSLVLFDRLSKYVHYRRASVEINSRYADATREELDAADDLCSICRESMDSAKKLPCVTGDHRVLTRSGWKYVARVREGDEVLSFNTGEDEKSDRCLMEWKPVTATMRHVIDPNSTDDTLYRMQGSGMDVVATHNHSMLLAQVSSQHGLQKRQPFQYMTVGKVLEQGFRNHKLSKHSAFDHTFDHNTMKSVVCAGYTRQPAVVILIPGMERVCMWWWHKDGQLRLLEFLGFWLSDGHLGTQSGVVCISQRRLVHTKWLVDLLNDVFPSLWSRNKSSEVEKGTSGKYCIRCPPLYEYLRHMAVGPPGYNPRSKSELRRYPHFTYDWTLEAQEQLSAYYRPYSTQDFGSRWNEDDMLDAFSLRGTIAGIRRHSFSSGFSTLPSHSAPDLRCPRCRAVNKDKVLLQEKTGYRLCTDCLVLIDSRESWEEDDVIWCPQQAVEERQVGQEHGQEECGQGLAQDEYEHMADTEEDSEADQRRLSLSSTATTELSVGSHGRNRALSSASTMSDIDVGEPLRMEGVKAEMDAEVMSVDESEAEDGLVWHNNGLVIVIDSQWYHLKRWMGDANQIANVYSRLSREQAIHLLDGFCRADGQWDSVTYRADGEPLGEWRCSSSSFPLIDHLMLIGQLAGAAVSLELSKRAGTETKVNQRTVNFRADHWRLLFRFSSSEARDTPCCLQLTPLAKPVDVSNSIEDRGNYQYEDDTNEQTTVFCIKVQDNANFLTQRLSIQRVQSRDQTTGVRAHSVFVGNCGHLFHRTCITQWMEYKGICPSCRAPLLHTAVARETAAAQARQQQAAQQQRIAAMYPAQAAARQAATSAAQPQPSAQPHSHSQLQPSSSSSSQSASQPVNDDNLEATLALIRQLQAQDAAQLGSLDFGMLNLANGLTGRAAAAPQNGHSAAAAAAAGAAGAANDRQHGAARPVGVIGRSLFRISSSSIASWLPSFTFELVRGAANDDFNERALAQTEPRQPPSQRVAAHAAHAEAAGRSAGAATPTPSPQPAISPLAHASLSSHAAPDEAKDGSRQPQQATAPFFPHSSSSSSVERKEDVDDMWSSPSPPASPLLSSFSTNSPLASSNSTSATFASSERARRDLIFEAFQRRQSATSNPTTPTASDPASAASTHVHTTSSQQSGPPVSSTAQVGHAAVDANSDDEKLDSAFDDINRRVSGEETEESEWSDEDELVRTISHALNSKQRDVEHAADRLAE